MFNSLDIKLNPQIAFLGNSFILINSHLEHFFKTIYAVSLSNEDEKQKRKATIEFTLFNLYKTDIYCQTHMGDIFVIEHNLAY